MRIYMAAYYQSRRNNPDKTVFSKPAWFADPAYTLESFHYMAQQPQTMEVIRDDKRKIFLDSGAFSMFTQGVTVDLEAYAKFVKDNVDVIDAASNLDVIGKGHEQESYDRQKQLEGLGAKVLPVHHVRDVDRWLVQYLEEGYDYICLGGMVPETTPHLRAWLDHVWHRYLTKPDGTPKVKVHGFGLTTLELMFRYPWFSVDSTSWVMTAMFGSVFIDLVQPDGRIRDYKVDFSSKSSKRKNIDSWHYVNLDKETQRRIMDRVEELEAVRPRYPELEAELEEATGFKQGYNLTALAEAYGWRDHFNINYFRRAQERAVKTFKLEQQTLFT